MARPGGRRIHPVSLGSSRCALGVVRFIRVAGFIGVRPCVRQIHQESFGSIACALGVVWLIRGIWVHVGASWGSFGVVGFVRVCLGSRGCTMLVVGVHWVHAGVPLWLSGSFAVVVFTPVCPWGPRVNSGSLGLLGYALVVVGFMRLV